MYFYNVKNMGNILSVFIYGYLRLKVKRIKVLFTMSYVWTKKKKATQNIEPGNTNLAGKSLKVLREIPI